MVDMRWGADSAPKRKVRGLPLKCEDLSSTFRIHIKKNKSWVGVVIHACDSRTGEVETGGPSDWLARWSSLLVKF